MKKSYDIFRQLCDDNQVTPYRVSKETGVAQNTLSYWKKGVSTPKIDKLSQLAKYFDKPVTIFLEEGK